MPVTVHLAKAKIKDNNGNYHAIDAFSDQSGITIAEGLANIETLKSQALKAISNDSNNLNQQGALQKALANIKNEKTQAINDIQSEGTDQIENLKSAASHAQETWNSFNTQVSTTLVTDVDNANMISESFETANNYPAHSYVRYASNENINLYYLPEGHTAGTSWENTKKIQVTISNELKSIQRNITNDRMSAQPIWIATTEIASSIGAYTDIAQLYNKYIARQYLVFQRNDTEVDYNYLVNLQGSIVFDKKTIITDTDNWAVNAETDTPPSYAHKFRYQTKFEDLDIAATPLAGTTILNSNKSMLSQSNGRVVGQVLKQTISGVNASAKKVLISIPDQNGHYSHMPLETFQENYLPSLLPLTVYTRTTNFNNNHTKYIAVPKETAKRLEYKTASSNIIKQNASKLLFLLNNAVKPINVKDSPGGWGYLSAQPKSLTLLHFSDIHADKTELQELITLRDYFKASQDYFKLNKITDFSEQARNQLINDIICTGDLVFQYQDQDWTYWDQVTGSENILLAIGNHDVHSRQGQQSLDEANTYDRYFSSNINNWGITCHDGKKTYYCKDYNDENIRLIVLNDMLTDQSEQFAWFKNTALNTTKNIVIAKHSPFTNSEDAKIACNWTRIDKGIAVAGPLNSYKDGDDTYFSKVNEFNNDPEKGRCICWLAGHTHCDFILHHPVYPDQLCIVIDAASRKQCNQYSDVMRVDGTITQDLANLITFDTSTHTIRIIRVGCNINSYLVPRNTITIRYPYTETITNDDDTTTTITHVAEILAQT